MGCLCSKSSSFESELQGRDFPRLPARVREKIFRYLSNHDKLRMRRVCKSFKSEIDLGAGLEVNVSDMELGVFEFMKNIECVGARVYHMSTSILNYLHHKLDRDKNGLYRCRYNVRFLEIHGHMSIKFLKYIILPLSSTLLELTIHNMCLMTAYLNAFPPPVEPPDDYHPFPNLRSLTIYYGHWACEEGSWKIFNDNMRYILKTIYSPKLKDFRVFRDPQTLDQIMYHDFQISHQYLRWESHPVKLFVQKHRASLRVLELLFYRDHFTPEEQYYICPTTLLEFSLFSPALKTNLPSDLTESYFQKTLEYQKRLRRIHLHMELFGSAYYYFRVLERIVLPNNFQTLRNISLLSYHHKHHPDDDTMDIFLDFSIFHECKKLRKFLYSVAHKRKSRKPDAFYAVKLEELPDQIEELTLEGITCNSDELEKVARFPNLRRVQIMHAGDKLNFGVTFSVARLFLIHKTIEYVKFKEFNEQGEPKIRALIEKFDGKTIDGIEINDPQHKINCWDKLGCCRCLLCLGDDMLKLE